MLFSDPFPEAFENGRSLERSRDRNNGGSGQSVTVQTLRRQHVGLDQLENSRLRKNSEDAMLFWRIVGTNENRT